MIYTQKLRVVSLAIVAIAISLSSVSTARAVSVLYTIDPTRSSLTINQDPTVTLANPTGDVTKLLNVAVKAQSPGADVDFYTGTIAADLTGVTLTFTGGSSIVAGLNPGAVPFSPNVNKGVDNYGIQTISATPTTGGIVFAALRNTSYDITSGSLSDGTVPTGMNLQIPNGAFGDITLFGKASTAGGGLNSTGVAASLTTSGGIETLIIPITRITGTSAHVVSIGQFVATRVVPEPSTMVLGGLGVVALALGAWRKRSR
jgi:hypothetical protein